MKRYIRSNIDLSDIEFPRRILKGTIEDTGEPCQMEANGFWIGNGGRHITSYLRVDKEDNRQYSMDRHHRFWIETED